MGETTGISWCDHTFNPWWICTEVSPGCDECYARELAHRYGWGWGVGVPRRFFGDKHWQEPLKWNEKARAVGVMRKVFCASMADILDTDPVSADQMNEARERLWVLIRKTEHLIWQLLTKRPHLYSNLVPSDIQELPRVWKGFTAEDQPNYDARWPYMKRLPGITWCSYEPAIGPLTTFKVWHKPNWFVFGGESGNHRRPCEASWASALLKECRARGVPFFMKQMSARTPAEGKALIPPALNIQEFPA